MSTSDLTKKRCVPCEGGVPKLTAAESQKLLTEVPGWALEGERIHRDYTFKNFVEAMSFLNRVKDVAESEGHHPDFHLTRYKYVRIEIWTHAVGGLTENDFIVAAKIDSLDR